MKYVDPVITERYARALFNTAKRKAVTRAVLDETLSLRGLTGVRAKLQMFLDSPQIPTEQKVGLLERALKPHLNPLLFNLITLLLHKGRMDHLRAILRRYKVLVEQDQGILEATVATARGIGEFEQVRLQTALESFMKARLMVTYKVEPALIGGVRFTCGDVLIDDSVRGKLDRLRQQLESVVNR
jgi:F-type H+-transporting ATPase subunit delta